MFDKNTIIKMFQEEKAIPQEKLDAVLKAINQEMGNTKDEEEVRDEKYYLGLKKKDYSRVTSAEDFKSEGLYEVLYGGLYTDYAGSIYVARADISNVEYDLERIAQEIGKTTLSSLFKKKCKEKKSELKEEYKKKKIREAELEKQRKREKAEEQATMASKTQFTNLPDFCTGNKFISPEWRTDQGGAHRMEETVKTAKVIKACDAPVLINREVVDCYASPTEENGEEKYEILFQGMRNQWKTLTVERDKLVNPRKAIDLAKYGLPISAETVQAFCSYMNSMLTETARRGGFPILRETNKLMVIEGGKYIMTYRDKDVSFGRKNDFPRLIQGLQPRGEREKWYRKFKELRAIDNIPLNFATAATLCAPIQAVIEGDGFVCDLYGNSGCGKSVIDKTAATIWGDNHFSAGFVYSAKSTDCAIEIALDTLHCLPLIIEDFNQLDTRKKRAFMQSVMLIANGIGKARGQKDMSLRSQLIWKTVAIINSEQPITAYFTTGGGINRVLKCRMEDGFPWYNEDGTMRAGEIMDFFSENSGHCGLDFIAVLNKLGPEKIKAKVEEYCNKIRPLAQEEGRSQRQVICLAVLLTADYIAEKYIFQDGINLKMEDALGFMEFENRVDQYMRFYESLEDRMNSAPDKFEGLGGEDSADSFRGGFWGVYKTEKNPITGEQDRFLCIIPKVLEDWMKKEDVNKEMFLSTLEDKGLLDSDKDVHTKKVPVKHRNDRIRMLCIKLPNDTKEEEVKGKTEGKQLAFPVKKTEAKEAFCRTDENPFAEIA